MRKFEGMLICTDLDGTLLRNDKTISEENIEAIEYFKREGGLFTFVTGRMPFFVSDIYEAVKPNAPIGCVNGGGLYDYTSGEYIWQADMPSGVTELIESVYNKLPEVGIQVNTYHNVYFCRENETMRIFRELTGVPNNTCRYTEVSEPIAKIVFGTELDDEIELTEKTLKSHPLAENFGFIRSEKTLYEILPKNIGKSTAVQKLCDVMKLDRAKTVAIGDYDNDISMLKAAGMGVAVANASPRASEAADWHTVSNDENAVARVIYDIEAGRLLK